jgi:WD40 repeat protein/serine/threonine protein kinase
MPQPNESHAEAGSQTWTRREALIRRFEHAWQAGQRPAIDDYLPAEGPERHALLIELAHADLEMRLRAGECARVEDYLTRYPELASHPETFIELAAAEYRQRRARQEDVTPTEYLQRFPGHQEALRRRLLAEPRDKIIFWPDATPTDVPAPAGSGPTPTPPSDTGPRPARSDGLHVPGYEMLEELGRGGMGIVYKARQIGLNRLVALKMILAIGHVGQEQRLRFRTEAEAVARLQHPNIVQIFEIGEVSSGPFFSLELVPGGSLAHHMDGTPFPVRPAAQLVATLAHAMHAAHQQGIVHRDLKPANILLAMGPPPSPGSESSNGERPEPPADWFLHAVPKITDFGLAKRVDVETPGPQREALHAPLSAGQPLTQSGAIVGTPSYMAPEQARGKPDRVGPVTDVYALGTILYELLTGRPPFKAATPLDTVMQVIAQEPVPLTYFQPSLPRDLETVCLKCLEKEPLRRYGTAAELAEELERFLQGKPVRARPIGQFARTWRWCRRNPTVASLLAAVAFLLVGGVAIASYFAVEAAFRAREADRHAKVARESEAKAKVSEGQARESARQAYQHLYVAHMTLAQTAYQEANMGLARRLLEKQQPERTGNIDLRGFEWFHLWRLSHLELLTLEGHRGRVTQIALNPAGTQLASASDDWTVKVWNPVNGKPINTLPGHTGAVHCVAFGTDGQRLCSGSEDRTVKVWDPIRGKLIRTLQGHQGVIWSLAFSPDGKLLASGSWDGTVMVWDAATLKPVHTLRGKTQIWGVAFSPDGKRLVSLNGDLTANVWDPGSAKLLKALPAAGFAHAFVFSPDGRRVASAAIDRTTGRTTLVNIMDFPSGKLVQTFAGHSNEVVSVAFSPGGRHVASASWDGTVKVWDLATGELFQTFLGHTGAVNSVAFRPDGQGLASGSHDGTVKVWDLANGELAENIQGHSVLCSAIVFSPDGKRLATGGADRLVKVSDSATGQLLQTCSGHHGEITTLAFRPDGRLLASGGIDGVVQVWDTASGKRIQRIQVSGPFVQCVALRPDGKRLISSDMQGTAKVRDPTTGKLLATHPGQGTVKVWDPTTGKLLATYPGPGGRVLRMAINPKGNRLASAGDDPTVSVFDLTSGKVIQRLHGHSRFIMCVAFSTDGQYLATGGVDRTIIIWRLATGNQVQKLQGHTSFVSCLTFSADGKRLASGSEDQTVKVWDLTTGEQVQTLGHPSGLSSVAFSPDGKCLACGLTAGTVKVWDGRTQTPAILAARHRAFQESMLAWHRQQARECEQAGNRFAAAFHQGRSTLRTR